MRRNEKKKYIQPLIEVHKIDTEISLVMMTSEDEIPDDPFSAAPAPPNQPASKQQPPNPFENNPFEEN